MVMFQKRVMAAFLAAAFIMIGSANAGTIVDTKLSLVIDVSSSISNAEYNLQMDGYAAAFRSPTIQNQILSTANGRLGQVAINTVFFSTNPTANNPFVLLDSAEDIDDFADFLDNLARPGGLGGLTGIGRAITQSTSDLVNTDDFEGKLVMDVSGDGTNNIGPEPSGPRDDAAAVGITINGISIGGAALENYYNANVRTSNGFVIPADNFEDFASSVEQKLFRELGGEVPEPNSLAIAMVLASIGSMAGRRRRKLA